ncbi:MAG: hypothetical protein ACOH2E_04425 [Candidatus Paracaedibacter sp.]
MNIIIRIIALFILIGLNNVNHATGSEEVDSNSCRTLSKDWQDMQRMFPNKSLGEVLVQINQDQGAISIILGGAAGTPIEKSENIQDLVAVDVLPTIQPPLPVNYPAYPYVPKDITSDLIQVISQINPGGGTLGAAVNTEVALIGVVSFPAIVPLPNPYPYVSSGIIHTDLVKAIGQIDTIGGVNLGQAVTNVVNKIGITSTHIPTPVIPNPLLAPPFIFGPVPANRDSSGIIMNDLNTFNSMLNPAPSASVGLTYQALLDRLAILFRDGGVINVAAGTTLPSTLEEILTTLGV